MIGPEPSPPPPWPTVAVLAAMLGALVGAAVATMLAAPSSVNGRVVVAPAVEVVLTLPPWPTQRPELVVVLATEPPRWTATAAGTRAPYVAPTPTPTPTPLPACGTPQPDRVCRWGQGTSPATAADGAAGIGSAGEDR